MWRGAAQTVSMCEARQHAGFLMSEKKRKLKSFLLPLAIPTATYSAQERGPPLAVLTYLTSVHSSDTTKTSARNCVRRQPTAQSLSLVCAP